MKKYVTTKLVQPVAFRLATLSLVMSAVLGSASVIAGEKLICPLSRVVPGLIRKSGQP